MKLYTYIIIGASAAGISAINTLWRLDPAASIVCISDQAEQPYNTCLLADVASGKKSADQIALRVAHQSVDFKYGMKVVAINCEKKSITLSDNSEMLYQKLLLATGTRTNIPEISKFCGAGIFAFHTLADLQAMLAWMQQKIVRHSVIIGAGLTGLECADALYNRAIQITIVEKEPHILAGLLPLHGAVMVQKVLQKKGVQLFLNQTVSHIMHGAQGINTITLANGVCIKTDMIIWAGGVQPNSEVAQAAGIAMRAKHIVVNEQMQTSDQSIYAAGDVALLQNQEKMPYLWAAAVHQGSIAAHAMAGINLPHASQPMQVTSHFFEFKFAASIASNTQQRETQEIQNESEYLCVTYEKKVPVGFQFVGETLDAIADIRRAIFRKN
jgi:NAD(P)H-nitrite reductase large subunit